MDWGAIVVALLSSWQGLVIGIVVGVGVAYLTYRFLADKPKIVSIGVQVLEAAEAIIKSLLGQKWAPVFNAMLSAGQAALDGAVTVDEAKTVARAAFDAAIAIAGISLNEDEKDKVLKVLDMVIIVLIKDKAAGTVVIKRAKAAL